MRDLWYKNAIIYGIDVERFYDSNGDGIGDLPGLVEKLDYLADLGVTCLWLLPIYPSPDRDNHYDVEDYFHVHPTFGTLTDFISFVHHAGERGLSVLVDLVINHTSNEHPWFQAAVLDPESRYRNYYTWADNPPPTPPGRGNVFRGQEQGVWTYDDRAGAYYHHRFYHFQPGLDATNPEVREEFKRIMDFWLALDVAGFRVDAASHLVELTGLEMNPKFDGHRIMRELREFLSLRRSNGVLLGEADVQPEQLAAFFGDNDELNMLFNFALTNYLFLALAREDGWPISKALHELPAIPQTCQWVNFLRNLDELDLERLTDAERADVFERFAPEDDMQIFGRGVRRRLAPMLDGARDRLELAFSLLFALPGTPCIVYGDEIGMGDGLEREGRNAVRSPMQWWAEKNAGFSTAPEAELAQRVMSGGKFGYESVNVADQQADPDSLLNWMKQLIAVRRACPEIGYGAWHAFATDNEAALAHRYAWKQDVVVTVHNLSGDATSVTLDLPSQRSRRLNNLFVDGAYLAIDGGSVEIELEPYGYRWFRVEGERGEGEAADGTAG